MPYSVDANGFLYDADAAEDTYLRPVVPTGSPYGSPYHTPYGSPHHSPYASPRGSPNGHPMYLSEDYNYVQAGTGIVGVPMLPASFVPLPPSPSMLTPRLPSPRVSPRRVPIPLPAASPNPVYVAPTYYHSFDPYYFPQVAPAYPAPQRERAPRSSVHPLLSADAHYMYLDLSARTFNPLTPSQPSGSDRLTLVPLREGYLAQTASYPATGSLTIRCGALGKEWARHWTVPISLRRTVSVGDVLHAVHESLQTQITHSEWAKCSRDEMYTASRAYTKRVRKDQYDGVEGVRRVDFLGDKHYFAGLEKVREDDPTTFELLVRARK